MKSVYYTLTTTAFGNVAVVWRQDDGAPAIVKICLPGESVRTDNLVQQSFPGAGKRSHSNVDKVCGQILEYLAGDAVQFSLDILDMSMCTGFQRNILNQAWLIPKGMVSTYRRLAERSRTPGGARAVGNALANNPYPIIIPCHRVIRADGSLGGFGGGLEMKKTLLGMEGVVFDAKGNVLPQFLW